MTQMVGGPLEYLENTIKTLKGIATQANKDLNRFSVILLTYPT